MSRNEKRRAVTGDVLGLEMADERVKAGVFEEGCVEGCVRNLGCETTDVIGRRGSRAHCDGPLNADVVLHILSERLEFSGKVQGDLGLRGPDEHFCFELASSEQGQVFGLHVLEVDEDDVGFQLMVWVLSRGFHGWCLSRGGDRSERKRRSYLLFDLGLGEGLAIWYVGLSHEGKTREKWLGHTIESGFRAWAVSRESTAQTFSVVALPAGHGRGWRVALPVFHADRRSRAAVQGDGALVSERWPTRLDLRMPFF
jgi:hypothetical protein